MPAHTASIGFYSLAVQPKLKITVYDGGLLQASNMFGFKTSNTWGRPSTGCISRRLLLVALIFAMLLTIISRSATCSMTTSSA